MGYNKIPLALGFNDSTGNASGLVEFTLNLSDVGDACLSAPEEGQALVYNADGKWCPANVGAGTFSGNLSDVGQVCDNQPTNGQSLVWSGGVTGSWCPSTVATGGGGGGIPDPGGSASDVLAYNGSDWVAASREVLNLAIVNQANTFTQTNIFGGATAASQTNINGSTGNVTVGSAGNTTTIATNGQLSVGTTGANQIVLNVVSGVIVGDNTDPDHVDIQTDGTVFVGSATGDGSGIALYSTGKISFPVNTTEASLIEAGDVGWDSGSETLALKLNGVIAHVAEDSLIRVRNQTGSAINSFSAVYVSGVQGENPAIALANNTLSQSTQRILGVTMGSISDGGTGFIITKGLLKNVNTSLFTSGNLLYVASGGAVTSAIPDHPNSIIRLGKVLKQDATEGIVLVEVQHGFAANEIDNITADANSVMFTDSASSISSLSGASGSLVYFSGTTPRPVLTGISTILTEGSERVEDHNIQDLNNVQDVEAFTDGDVLVYQTDTGFTPFASSIFGTGGDSISHHELLNLDADDHTQYVLANGDRVVSGLTVDLSSTFSGPMVIRQDDVDVDTLCLQTATSGSEASPVLKLQRNASGTLSATDGDYLGQIKFNGERDAGANVLYAKITGKIADASQGTEDGLIELAVKRAGANVITTRFTQDCLKLINSCGIEVDGGMDVTGFATFSGTSAVSASVATTPTEATHVANKSYVDSQIPTPSYFQALASGSITGVADEALTILGWATSGTYALSDPGGNVVLDDADTPDLSVINISGTGVYQIDATVRVSNTTDRGGIVFRIYLDTGSGFTDIPELRSSNYASRGTGSGEGITNGSCSINTILSLNAGDSLQFRAQPKTAGATSIIQQEGTYVRIVKIA